MGRYSGVLNLCGKRRLHWGIDSVREAWRRGRWENSVLQRTAGGLQERLKMSWRKGMGEEKTMKTAKTLGFVGSEESAYSA
jgi:hypothetical protein